MSSVCTKIQQRLYFLRRLRVFGVEQRVLMLFYQAVIESVLRYGIVAWFGNISVKLKSQINRLVHTAMKAMGVREYPSLQTLFEKTIVKQARKIIAFPSHVLYSEYELLPSGRVPTKYRKKILE